MPDMIEVDGLKVADELKRFIDEEALPGTGLEPDAFWSAFSDILNSMAPRNRSLVRRPRSAPTRAPRRARAPC